MILSSKVLNLKNAGYEYYEVSAFANLSIKANIILYWRFGDYLALVAVHMAKLPALKQGKSAAFKIKHPRGYLDLTRSFLDQSWIVAPDDLALNIL